MAETPYDQLRRLIMEADDNLAIAYDRALNSDRDKWPEMTRHLVLCITRCGQAVEAIAAIRDPDFFDVTKG